MLNKDLITIKHPISTQFFYFTRSVTILTVDINILFTKHIMLNYIIVSL